MRWNVLLFGTPTPTWQRKAGAYSIFALMILAIYGMRAKFLPSEWWASASLMATHAATVVAVGLLWWGASKGALPLNHDIDRRRKIAAILLGPFILWGAFWTVLTLSVPDLITRFTGAPGSITLALRKEQTHSHRSCDRRVTGGKLKDHFPGYLCVYSASFNELPERGLMDLIGTRTALGLHVTDVRPAAAETHSQ